MHSIERRPHPRRLASISIFAFAASFPALPALAQDSGRDPHIVVTGERSTLTVPDTAGATANIQRTPGAVEIVPDTAFKNTPVQHIKDILGYVPGVITQPRMGDDARISIRGSGLSRAYGARGIVLLLDGVPMNTSDGLVDFFEVDPSAYRYVEVFKGANALRYGANALGGAINLVTPTGYDAIRLDGRVDGGSFGYVKGQASTGGVSGHLDWFVTASGQRIDGYRDHSGGNALRANANVGYRFSPTAETRFYVTAARTRQLIPGEVSKEQALGAPREANPVWVDQDQARDVNSVRLANKTTLRFGRTTLELGGFYNDRHVMHPIYQWLDYTVDDYGGFVRVIDDGSFGGLRNRLVLGANVHNGTIDTEQFVNTGGEKGAPTTSMVDKSANVSAYAEDSLFLHPNLAVVAGVQYLHAKRDRTDRFLSDGDQSGSETFDLWSPKLGLLWDVDPTWQVFANVSRSGEVPSFDANVISAPALKAQRATSFEIGTRGRKGAIGWDLSLYRAELRNELQCLTTAPWALCTQINVDRTVHQGLEAGLDATVLRSAIASGDSILVNTAYTWNDFRFDDDVLYGDNRMPGVPTHHLRAEVLYKHQNGFYAGPNIEWSPKSYFADNANSLSVDPFALLNFKAGYDLGSGISTYLEGRNLTDKRYISTVAIAGTASEASEIFNPGTGRAVFAGLRFRMQ